MSTRKMFALFKRELKDIFRDKKTLIMMIVVPLLLYPLLIIGMTLILNAVNASRMDATYKVAFVGVEEETAAALEAIADDKTRIDYVIERTDADDPGQALKDEEIHAYVTVEQADGQDRYEVHYLSAWDDSVTAADVMMDVLYNYREDVRKERAEQYQLNEKEILYPVTYELADASSAEESVGNYLGMFIPFLVITSICLGAIYPAIDVTAGERERGTLETLLTLPVTNFEMIMSKFLAVSIIASISAVLNICSLGGAFIFMFSFIGGTAAGGMKLEIATFIPAILFMLLVVIFFALFVTAVSMCTCIFAKSFKEANNYVTPVLLLFMFGGYSAMLPDLELTNVTAAIPIINMTMMMKGLFNFEYNYALFGIVLLSNVVYSVLTIMILARLYNSESILFAEGFTNIRIFTKRSEMKKGALAGIGDVVLLLCLVLLVLFYIGSFAAVKWGIYGVMVQQLLILLLPLAYAWYIKSDMKRMFSLRMPKPSAVISAVFLFAGAFLCNLILAGVISVFFRESAQNVEETFAGLFDAPFAVILLITAFLPAVGEELLFRGFTFTAIRQKCRPLTTILLVSALFGLYHMSIVRFVTTAFLGVFLALLVEKSGSIFPGMLFHFLINAAADIISVYEEPMAKYFPILTKESLSIIEVAGILVVGAVCICIGWFFL
ncbi:MAG: CPBP family intramembrane metalloprotease [Lachnospiraceae bacterium]|nr:CPBP family intramembrane metalloprotease [Lachnospiraceae bacterium]